MNASIPVHVITGFLGSGKTTLLKSMIQDEAFGDSALLINEFGEVGLDDKLLGDIDQETVLLSSGCICCSIRGELAEALMNLANKRQDGTLPEFKRVIIETTGLADPGPIAATLANDMKVRNQFHFGTVLTVVDMQAAINSQQHEPVWTDQIAAADVIWFSKSDRVTEDVKLLVTENVEAVNSSAIQISKSDSVKLDELFQDKMKSTLLGKAFSFSAQDSLKSPLAGVIKNHTRNQPNHLKGIESFQIVLGGSLDWVTFGVWLSLLLHRHGQRLLRVKGLIYLAGTDQPVAIHGVQHTLFPPEHLSLKDVDSKDSKLIFITRGITRQTMVDSLNEFMKKLPNRLN